ncbi:MAG: hypothetical protein PVJ38_02510 [Candidatus Bathyarchaeota archaeon]|jgi:hypothetical protein
MVRYKGKDRIEFGYKDYAEVNYGGSPGATPTTLSKVGYVSELTPLYDPELNRVFVLRDVATPAPLALLSRRENVGLRLSWLQGQLGQYWQSEILAGDNFFGEAKIYRDASNELYLYWTGLKADVLSVRCSVGEPVIWSVEMIGESYDTKTSTIHSYGADPGDPWEWSETYVEISTDDSAYSTIPDITDWEFRVDNQLHPNFVCNDTGSKQLSSLEEMERLVSARLTMNLQDDTYLSYLLDQDELYLRLQLPDSKWLKVNKGKFQLVEPVLKPEDLIACRMEFIGRWLTHGF